MPIKFPNNTGKTNKIALKYPKKSKKYNFFKIRIANHEKLAFRIDLNFCNKSKKIIALICASLKCVFQ